MSKQFLPIIEKVAGLLKSDRWEAPERGFIGHRDILVQSRARYAFVAPYVRGRLLDVGCGRGYGFELLSPKSDEKMGVDISPIFLNEAQRLFPQVFFVCGSGGALPVASGWFDSVLAFEVIEHVADDSMFLDELRRVSRHDAFIALSTPNRLVSSGDSEKPLNRFHHREYTANEFYALLKGKFASVELFGQSERVNTNDVRNRLVDRIPLRWKYRLPHLVQTLASITLRPPLRLEECNFQTSTLTNASTFIALCRR